MAKDQIITLTELLERIGKEDTSNPRPLIDLVMWLRAGGEKGAAERLRLLTLELQKKSWHSHALSDLMGRVVGKHSFLRLFTESGLMNEDPFLTQAKNRLFNHILPAVYDDNDAVNLFNLLFSRRMDWKWVHAIPDEDWQAFLAELNVKEIFQLPRNHPLVTQLLNSIQILSLRITALGIKREILEKLPQLEEFDSPFMAQNSEITIYLQRFQEAEFDQSINNRDYLHIQVMLDQCEEYIDVIRDNKTTWGVTLKLTNFVIRLRQHLQRLRLLFHLITTHDEEPPFETEVQFLRELVRAENEKNSLSLLLKENFSLLAYQVTEHASQTGEEYITTTPKEYFAMYKKAFGGGLIVAYLVIFKIAISSWKLPLLFEALVFSLNYSIGFVLIHITHSKLATKQPAMIASHLARILDEERDSKQAAKRLAPLVVQVSRSQFVALLGNISAGIPLGLFLAWLWYEGTGASYISEAKAWSMINEIHPWQSLALWFGALTGVWLYLSGLISGYFDNLCIYARVPERIRRIEFLRNRMPPKMLIKFSNYIEENLGALADNVYFGFFLGCTTAVGIMLGLPIDTLHVTFSAAGFGVASMTLMDQLTLNTVLISLLGVVGIGMMNFTVSFGLSIITALRSRQVKFRLWRELLKEVLMLFIKNPIAFFVPGGGGRFIFKRPQPQPEE
ncbi:MAG: hypothetical protein CME71_00455 [Halobacteriovorax sp.]|nr:hypothetical protein [Halobacteriovorax sp.]